MKLFLLLLLVSKQLVVISLQHTFTLRHYDIHPVQRNFPSANALRHTVARLPLRKPDSPRPCRVVGGCSSTPWQFAVESNGLGLVSGRRKTAFYSPWGCLPKPWRHMESVG